MNEENRGLYIVQADCKKKKKFELLLTGLPLQLYPFPKREQKALFLTNQGGYC